MTKVPGAAAGAGCPDGAEKVAPGSLNGRLRGPRDLRRWLVDRLVGATRRLARGTQLDFDHRHGVETQRADSGTEIGGQPAAANSVAFYEATTVRHFRHLVAQLPRPLKHWTFVDIGSGKGRVILLAMGWPFRRVEGIEFRRDLHDIASANLQRYTGDRAAGAVALRCGDAVATPLPGGDLVVFFYNAFNGAVLEALLDHLEASVRAVPRRLLFVYSNPVERHRVDRRPAFRPISETASPYDLVWWGNRRAVVYELGDAEPAQRA